VRKLRPVILLVLIVLGGGTFWLLSGRQPIEEGRCCLVRKKAPRDSQLMAPAFQLLQPCVARPDSVRDLPAGFDRPAYYEIKSGDRHIPLVVNLSETPSLCIDTKGDGVLSQERCFVATRIRETKASNSSWRFGPISLAPRDAPPGADAGFYVNCFRVDRPASLTTYPAFVKVGRLRLDGQTYRVAVVDGDCDGRFHSILSLPLDGMWRFPGSDVFAIDLNRNGKFEISLHLSGRSEVMPLGHLVRFEDGYYAIDIAADGKSLALSKTEPRFGTLLIEPNDTTVEMRMWSDAADQHLARAQRWPLPMGKYMAIYAVLEKKDASGDVWSFTSDVSSAFARLGPLNFFVIEPEQTTRVRVGPPLVVTADVRQVGTGTVEISPIITGCGGEHYQADFRRNWRRPSERLFKIVDEKGTVLVADKFQYG